MKNKLKGSIGFLIVLIIAFFMPTGSAFAEEKQVEPATNDYKKIRVSEVLSPGLPSGFKCFWFFAPHQDPTCLIDGQTEKWSTWVVETPDPTDPSKDVVRRMVGKLKKTDCKEVLKTQPLPQLDTFTITSTDKNGDPKVEELTGIIATDVTSVDEIRWLRFTDVKKEYCNKRCYWRMGYKVCYP